MTRYLRLPRPRYLEGIGGGKPLINLIASLTMRSLIMVNTGRICKEGLRDFITSLSLKGFSGRVAIKGLTSAGVIEVRIELVRGEVIECLARFEGGLSFEGVKCLDFIDSLICIECSVSMEGLEGLSSSSGISSVGELSINHPICSQAVLANLVKASENVARLKRVKVFKAVEELLNRSYEGLSCLIALGEGVKASALALKGRVIDVCAWVKGVRYCGDDALNALREWGGSVEAELFRVNELRLLRWVRNEVLRAALKAGVK